MKIRFNAFIGAAIKGLLSIVVLSTNSVMGANISHSERYIFIEGTIEKGDSEKVAKILGSEKVVSRFHLNSPGGSLQEALKIASLIKGGNYDTRVEPGGQCASACFFVFLTNARRDAAGIDEIESANRAGRNHIYGKVGLHRPYVSLEVAKENPTDALKRQPVVMAETAQYLRENGVSQRLIDEMMDRPSNNIYWLSEQDILQLGEYSPQMEETFIASCGYSRYRYKEGWSKERRNKVMDCMLDFQVSHIWPIRRSFEIKLGRGWRPWKT